MDSAGSTTSTPTAIARVKQGTEDAQKGISALVKRASEDAKFFIDKANEMLKKSEELRLVITDLRTEKDKVMESDNDNFFLRDFYDDLKESMSKLMGMFDQLSAEQKETVLGINEMVENIVESIDAQNEYVQSLIKMDEAQAQAAQAAKEAAEATKETVAAEQEIATAESEAAAAAAEKESANRSLAESEEAVAEAISSEAQAMEDVSEGVQQGASNLEKFYRTCEGFADFVDELSSIMDSIPSKIASGMASAGSKIKNTFGPDIEYIGMSFKQLVMHANLAVYDLSTVFDSLSNVMTNVGTTIYDAFSIVTTVVGKVGSAVSKVGSSVASMASSIGGAIRNVGSILGNVFSEVKSVLGSVGSAVKTAIGAVTSLVSTLSGSIKNVGSAMKTAFSGVKSVFTTIQDSVKSVSKQIGSMVSTIGRGLKSAGSSMVSFASKTVKAATSMKLFGKNTSSSNTSMKQIVRNVLRYGLGIRSLFVLFNKLRSAIKEGIGYLEDADDAFKSTITSFKDQLTMLKASVGSAFQPILETAIPIINKLIESLSSAINVMGEFFAKLSGKDTYQKVVGLNYSDSSENDSNLKEQENAKKKQLQDQINDRKKALQEQRDAEKEALEEQRDAEKKALEDQKKAYEDQQKYNKNWEQYESDMEEYYKKLNQEQDKYLSGLDEMARFNEDEEPEMPTLEGVDADLGDLFDTDPIDDKYDKLLDDLEDKYDNLQDELDDELDGLLTDLEDEYSTKIPQVIYETVQVDDTISDLVDKLKEAWENADFSEIGEMLGTKLRDALENIDWEKIKETGQKIAKSLATLINGFIETPELGSTIGSSIADAIDTGVSIFQEFFDDTHFGSIGAFVREGIIHSLMEIDWPAVSELGSTIGENFALFVNGLFSPDENGETIGSALGTAASGICNALIGYINGFWSTLTETDIGYNFGVFLNTALPNIDWETCHDAFTTIAENITSNLSTFVGTTNWDGVGTAVSTGINTAIDTAKTLLEDAPFKSMGEAVAEMLSTALRGKEIFKNDASGNYVGSGEYAGGVDWTGLGETIKTGLQGALDFVSGILDGENGLKLSDLTNALEGVLEGLIGVDSDGGIDWESLGSKIKEGFQASFDNALAIIGGKDGLSLSGISEAIYGLLKGLLGENDDGGLDWRGLGSTIKEGLQRAFDELTKLLNSTGLSVGDIVSALWDIVLGIFGDDGNGGLDWTGIAESLKTGLQTVFDKASELLSGQNGLNLTTIKTALESILKVFLGTDNDGGIDWVGFGSSIKEGFQNAFNAAKDLLTGNDGINLEGITGALEDIIKGILGEDSNGGIKWSTLGDAVKTGFQTILDTAAGLFAGQNGLSVSGITTALEGVLKWMLGTDTEGHVDWRGFGSSIKEGFQIIFNSAAGLLDPENGFDLTTISGAISDIITGLVGADSNGNTDWAGLGATLRAGIQKAFNKASEIISGDAGLDLSGFVSAIEEILKGAIGVDEDGNLDWGAIGEKVKDGINAAIAKAGELMDTISTSGIVEAFLKFFDKVLGVGTEEGINWDELAGTISDGIIAACQALTGALTDERIDTVTEDFKKFFLAFKWKEVGKACLEAFVEGILAIDEVIGGTAQSLAEMALRAVFGDAPIDWLKEREQNAYDTYYKPIYDAQDARFGGHLETRSALMGLLQWTEWVDAAEEGAKNEIESSFDAEENVAKPILQKTGEAINNQAKNNTFSLDADAQDAYEQAITDEFVEAGTNAVEEAAPEVVSQYAADLANEEVHIGGDEETENKFQTSLNEAFEAAGKEAAEAAVESAVTNIESGITEAEVTIAAEEGEENMFTRLYDLFEKAGEQDGTAFVDKVEANIIEGLTSSELASSIEGLQVWSDIDDTMKNAGETAGNNFADGIVSAFSGLADSLKNTLNESISVLNNFVQRVTEAAQQVANRTADMNGYANSSPSWSYPNISSASIPKLATGAVIPPNAPFLALLGDQRSGTNVEAPLDTIKQAIREELGNLTGVSGGDITVRVPITLDGKQITEAVAKCAKQRKQMTGKNPLTAF